MLSISSCGFFTDYSANWADLSGKNSDRLLIFKETIFDETGDPGCEIQTTRIFY